MDKLIYVIKIDNESNTLIVGSREKAMKKEFYVSNLNWIVPYSEVLKELNDYSSMKINVKFRSTMKEQPATISLTDSKVVKVKFDEPQWAPAEGQSAVFYDDEVVLGGGVIVL